MKIAHVLTRFSPEENPGGVERVVEEIAKRQSEDHEVELICRNQFEDAEKEKYKGFNVKRASVLDVKGVRTFSSLFSMRKLIKKSDADVFHIHDWSPYLNYFFAGEPGNSVLTLHNRAFSSVSRRIQDYCVRRADKVSVVSQEVSREIDAKATKIPNGADLERFSPASRKEDNYFLFAGNIIEGKGSIELTSVWEEEWPELRIAGSGPLYEEISGQDNIEKLGELNYEEMPNAMESMKALILPSRSEGFGLVWAEAMATGKPVLATETGLGAEIPKFCGVTVSRDYSETELKEAVEELISREYSSDEIRKYAEENFDWDRIALEYISLYEDA